MRTCDVCYEEYDETTFFGLKCKHAYCQECMKEHLQNNIKDGNVVEIPCMMIGCPVTFAGDDVRQFGSKEIYEKFLQFKLNIDVDLNPNLKWCPQAGCNRYVKKTGMLNKTAKCDCGANVCLKCGQLAHPSKKCGTHEQEFIDWKKTNNCKFCPKCGISSYKFDGCNHMTCAKCKYSYCYICL